MRLPISNLDPVFHHFRDTAIYNLKLSIENCGQTAADGDMVTIDSLWKVAISLSVNTIADCLRLTVYPQYIRDIQTDKRTTSMPIARPLLKYARLKLRLERIAYRQHCACVVLCQARSVVYVRQRRWTRDAHERCRSEQNEEVALQKESRKGFVFFFVRVLFLLCLLLLVPDVNSLLASTWYANIFLKIQT